MTHQITSSHEVIFDGSAPNSLADKPPVSQDVPWIRLTHPARSGPSANAIMGMTCASRARAAAIGDPRRARPAAQFSSTFPLRTGPAGAGGGITLTYIHI
jgi:hypothetical protein